MKESLFKLKQFRKENLKMLWKISLVFTLLFSAFNQTAYSQLCVPVQLGVACGEDTVYLDAAGTAPAFTAGQLATAFGSNFATAGLCGGPLTYSLAQPAGYTCADIGVNTYTLTVTETGAGGGGAQPGDVITCSATITVLDTFAPSVVLNPIDTVYLDVTGKGTLDSNELDNGASDCGGIASILINDSIFTCADINTVIFVVSTVTDSSGNVNAFATQIIVLDTIDPVAVCISDTTLYLDPITGTISLTAADADGGSSDACGIFSLNINKPNFTCADTGSNPITLTVVDNNGNFSFCSFNLTILDTVKPVLTCMDTTVYLNAAGVAYFDTSFVLANLDEACLDSVWLSIDSAICGQDSINVTIYATDESGNIDSCTAKVYVLDTIAPVIYCTDTVVYLDSLTGKVSWDTSFVQDSIIENCSLDSVWMSVDSAECGVDSVIVTIYAMDNSGNIDSCQSIVRVLDTFAPVVVCKSSSNEVTSPTILIAPFGGSAVIPPFTGLPNATGNVTITVNYLGDLFVLGAGAVQTETSVISLPASTCAVPAIDVSTVSAAIFNGWNSDGSVGFTGVNPFGVTSPCVGGNSFSVSITLSYDELVISVYLDSNGKAKFDTSLVLDNVFDACLDSVWLSVDSVECGQDSVDVTIYATDMTGNIDSCTTKVYVLDTIKPIVYCSDSVVYLDQSGNVSFDTSYVLDSVYDNCPIDSVWLSIDTATCADIDSLVVTIYAQDHYGNIDSCKTYVKVYDTLAPIISCEQGTLTIFASLPQACNTVTGGSELLVFSGLSPATTDVTFKMIYNGDLGFGSEVLTLTETISGNPIGITTPSGSDCIADSVTFTIPMASYNAWLVLGGGSLNVTVQAASSVDNFCFAGSGVGGGNSFCVAPTLSAPVFPTVYLDSTTGIGYFDTSIVLINIDENCGIDSVWLSIDSATCADAALASIPVTIYALDVNGNLDSCESFVVVMDTFPPLIQCLDSSLTTTVYLDSNGIGYFDTSFVLDAVTDACLDSVWLNIDSALCNQDSLNITIYAMDNQGNIDSCETKIYIFDTLAPIVECADTTLYLDASNLIVIDSSFIIDTIWDNCQVDSIWISRDTFTCVDLGPNSVTLYAMDNSGNIDSCTAIVTIAAVLTIDTVVIQIDTFDVADTCLVQNELLFPPYTVSYLQIPTNGTINDYNGDTCFTYQRSSVPAKYIDTAIIVIEDQCGIRDTTVFIFVPTPTNETIYVQTIPSTNADTAVNLESTFMTGMHSGTCDASGTTNSGITLTITGLSVSYPVPNPVFTGDTACIIVCDTIHSLVICDTTTIIYVADTINPTIVCKNETVYLDATGSVTIDTSNTLTSVSDNTLLNAVWLSETTFDCTNIGTNMVTVYARDTNRNIDSCVSTITVLDTISPVASCQNITIQLDASGNASIVAADVNSGSSDNCSFTMSIDVTTFDCSNLGANTVVLTITDSSGNTSTCTSTVTVADTISPLVVCQSITVQLDATGNASITTADIDNGSTDNCSFTLSLDVTTFDCTNRGANTVTLTATDSTGNISTCTATVTVEDNIIPTTICKDITVQLDASGNVTITPADVDNGSSDNCVFNLTIDNGTFDCSNIGANTVTLTTTDSSGNSSTCTAIVVVRDTITPVATCQPMTAYLNASGNVTITASDVNNGSSDNCAITLTIDKNTFDCTNVGPNNVTLTVTDAAGNTATCVSSVLVLDTLNPTPMCKDLTVVLDASGNATIVVSDVNNGSSDNCGIATMSLSKTTFDCTNVGPNTVTLTVTDVNGNVDSCTSTVTVTETTAPIAVCQSITVQLDATGSVSITTTDIDNGSSDNCGIDTMWLDITDFDCTTVGANTVVLSVRDAAGNTSTCVATVTVEDTLLPTATCQDATVYLNASGNVTITTATVDNGSTDNCNFTMSIDKMSFDCTNIGANTVTLTVTDANGNVSTCTSTVTVMDTLNPIAVCQNLTIQLDALGNATIVASSIDNGSSDNCGIDTITIDVTSFTCANVGPNTVTLTVTDVNGNVSTCTSTVTVEDKIAPVAVCKDIIVQLDATGNASILPSDIDGGSSDACSFILTTNDSNFNCSDIGLNNITLTVTDPSGNTAICVSTVTVMDTLKPITICQDITVYLDAAGSATIVASNIDNGSSDNCAIATMTIDKSSFDCSEVGANTVTLTVTDVNGNVNTCTSTVTVLDTLNPITMCQSITVYLDATGNVSIDSSDIDNGSTDNCGIATITLSQNDFTCANIGVNAITMTVTDVNGNVDSCTSATVTVLDTLLPVITCQDVTVYLDVTGNVTFGTSDVVTSVSDNCGIDTVWMNVTSATCADDTINYTVYALDNSGNIDSCQSQIIVLDTIPTIVICNDTTLVLDKSNSITIDTSFVLTNIIYNCGIDSVWLSKTDFTCADLGANNVTIYVENVSGIVDSCIAVVTITHVPTTKSTFSVQLDRSGVADLCLTQNELIGNVYTYTSCHTPNKGALVNYNDTCFTYTQSSPVKYLDTACIIICDECGICDTTEIIFVPTPTIDTIVMGPVVPSTNVDTCVQLESTFMTARHTGTCDASGSSYGGTPLVITGICVRYPVSAPVFTGDTACIIVCDTILNVTICDTTIIIYLPDVTAPTVNCKNDVVYLDQFGQVTIDTSNVLSSVYDNTLINAVWLSKTIYTCADAGINTVTVYARDTNRNIDSCMATVTVLDTLAPITVCQDITIQLDANGDASIVALDVEGGSTDNCAIASFAVSKTDFDCSNIGANTVILTVTDVWGNSSECTAIVTVEDNIAPIVICPADKLVTIRNTTCAFIIGDYISEASATDNCADGGIVITQSPAAGTEVIAENRNETITLTATDASGNTSTCSFDVYVRCIREIPIPQFFSPDGNGINDTWEIPELSDYPNNVVKVYNRWGTLVFEQKGYTTGWNGISNISSAIGNNTVEDGTYFYIVDLGENSTIEPYVGYVHIKK